MARYTGPKAKLCRKFGTNIFGSPKYDRILGKKPYGPGQQGRYKRRSKASDYGIRLREKQKVKYTYGLLEKQFRGIYQRCAAKSENTGLLMLQTLECRLDNIVYRMGFATSRAEARIWVTHGHFAVNGRRLSIPSAAIKEGAVITLVGKSVKLKQKVRDICVARTVSSWCDVDAETLTGKFVTVPTRGEMDPEIQENLIVEYFSK